MQTDLLKQLAQKLTHLRESVQQDSDSLGSFPDGKAIFDRLFDAVETTLQNVNDSSPDRLE